MRLGPTDLPGAEGHAAPAPVRAAVDGMLTAGCPRAKLVLGLPFYGRSLEQPGRLTLTLTLTLTSNRNPNLNPNPNPNPNPNSNNLNPNPDPNP